MAAPLTEANPQYLDQTALADIHGQRAVDEGVLVPPH
jgi:hypothetical protein